LHTGTSDQRNAHPNCEKVVPADESKGHESRVLEKVRPYFERVGADIEQPEEAAPV